MHAASSICRRCSCGGCSRRTSRRGVHHPRCSRGCSLPLPRAWRFGYWSALTTDSRMLGGSSAGLASPGATEAVRRHAAPAALCCSRSGFATAGFGRGACSPASSGSRSSRTRSCSNTCCSWRDASAVRRLRRPAGLSGSRNVAIQRIGLAFSAVVLGCLLGAIQYWPSDRYRRSPRAGHGRADATSYSYQSEVLSWYWPQFSGIIEQYWGRNNIHLQRLLRHSCSCSWVRRSVYAAENWALLDRRVHRL